ncbi:MAG: hypothetical protein HOK98_12930 [Rhodospirillaceae bacterium]|jgi:hypothetical protein|nr:hypothetical protein [Rhodospirillaceae bacterium]MBT5943688.1 hypothetical protein [Rhodospirillaceae bacterium]MBT6404303.1 hypothetical protein [Rhodospirillaceae bacterium]MBT6537078.1 hypothetical protein [Rhodospirillaceae bacterium]MBT7363139.1 hypothetical protein [Rhodospirillaceae bacterium]
MNDETDINEFPEILIGPSGAKFAITMAIMCAMIGGAYWVVFRILTGATAGGLQALPLLICGGGALIATFWLLLSLHARLYGQPRLRIDETGISDPSGRFSLGTITWDQIRDVRGMPHKQVVWVLVDDKKAVLGQMHPLRRALIWFDSAFAKNIIKLNTWRLDINRDHLLGILAHYHRKFGNPRK